MEFELPKVELKPWKNTSLVCIGETWNYFTVRIMQAFQSHIKQKYANTPISNDDKLYWDTQYKETIEREKKNWDKICKEGDKKNTQIFLDNPKKVLQEIEENKGCFDVSEMLRMFEQSP